VIVIDVNPCNAPLTHAVALASASASRSRASASRKAASRAFGFEDSALLLPSP